MRPDAQNGKLGADTLCRIVKESGMDEIDIAQTDVEIYGKEALLAAMKAYGIRCGCLSVSTAEDVNAGPVLAKEMGAPYLMIVPESAEVPDACLAKAVELAKTYGIRVIFENAPDPHMFLSSAENCKAVLDRVPGLDFAFNTANFRAADKESDVFAAYELLKDRIVRIHVKDIRVNGNAVRTVFPGSGVIPVEEILQRSIQDGFDSTYAVEYAANSDARGADHKDAVSACAAVLRQMAGGNFVKCPKVAFPGLEKPVSKIFFGTAIPQMLQYSNAQFALDLAYASGINAFDCARGYGDAEIALGEWIKERKNREDVVVLSKCGNVSPEGVVYVKKEVIERELAESLERLQTDYIDIYLLHRDDPTTPVSEFIDTLNAAKRAGKVKLFGVSNWTPERIREANRYAEAHGLDGFSVSSPNYGLARQVNDPWGGGCVTISGPENEENRKWYTETGIPVIAYSSLGRGFFSGAFPSYDYEAAGKILDEVAQKGYISEDNMERLRRAEILAKEKNCTVSEIAMRYLFSSDMNVFAIVSVTIPQFMWQNVKAPRNLLTKEEVRWLDLITD